MKLQAKVKDEIIDLEIIEDEGRVVARVDEREYEVEAKEIESGVWLIRNNGYIYETLIAKTTAGEVEVTISDERFPVEIIDPKRLRGLGDGHSHDHGLVEIRTAMPGKVVRILAEVGQTVEKGAGVIVVEAMKMQNELRSPRDGVVREIRVVEGSTVNAGEILIVIE